MSAKLRYLESAFGELNERVSKAREPTAVEPRGGAYEGRPAHSAPAAAPAPPNDSAAFGRPDERSATISGLRDDVPDAWANSCWGRAHGGSCQQGGCNAMPVQPPMGQQNASVYNTPNVQTSTPPVFQAEELNNERTRVYDEKTAQDATNQYDGDERKCRAWACLTEVYDWAVRGI